MRGDSRTDMAREDKNETSGGASEASQPRKNRGGTVGETAADALRERAAALALAAAERLSVTPVCEIETPRIKGIGEEAERLLEPFAAAFKAFDGTLRAKGSITAAIDGGCGAGKSTFAEALRLLFGGNVFHVDDYFLPADSDTEDNVKFARKYCENAGADGEKESEIFRLARYDAPRFCAEVGTVCKEKRPTLLQRFDCRSQRLEANGIANPHGINIIEGAYSFSASLFLPFDLKLFLFPSPGLQRRRITARGGAAGYRAFERRWIPAENAYFALLQAKEFADVVIELC